MGTKRKRSVASQGASGPKEGETSTVKGKVAQYFRSGWGNHLPASVWVAGLDQLFHGQVCADDDGAADGEGFDKKLSATLLDLVQSFFQRRSPPSPLAIEYAKALAENNMLPLPDVFVMLRKGSQPNHPHHFGAVLDFLSTVCQVFEFSEGTSPSSFNVMFDIYCQGLEHCTEIQSTHSHSPDQQRSVHNAFDCADALLNVFQRGPLAMGLDSLDTQTDHGTRLLSIKSKMESPGSSSSGVPSWWSSLNNHPLWEAWHVWCSPHLHTHLWEDQELQAPLHLSRDAFPSLVFLFESPAVVLSDDKVVVAFLTSLSLHERTPPALFVLNLIRACLSSRRRLHQSLLLWHIPRWLSLLIESSPSFQRRHVEEAITKMKSLLQLCQWDVPSEGTPRDPLAYIVHGCARAGLVDAQTVLGAFSEAGIQISADPTPKSASEQTVAALQTSLNDPSLANQPEVVERVSGELRSLIESDTGFGHDLSAQLEALLTRVLDVTAPVPQSVLLSALDSLMRDHVIESLQMSGLFSPLLLKAVALCDGYGSKQLEVTPHHQAPQVVFQKILQMVTRWTESGEAFDPQLLQHTLKDHYSTSHFAKYRSRNSAAYGTQEEKIAHGSKLSAVLLNPQTSEQDIRVICTPWQSLFSLDGLVQSLAMAHAQAVLSLQQWAETMEKLVRALPHLTLASFMAMCDVIGGSWPLSATQSVTMDKGTYSTATERERALSVHTHVTVRLKSALESEVSLLQQVSNWRPRLCQVYLSMFQKIAFPEPAVPSPRGVGPQSMGIALKEWMHGGTPACAHEYPLNTFAQLLESLGGTQFCAAVLKELLDSTGDQPLEKAAHRAKMMAHLVALVTMSTGDKSVLNALFVDVFQKFGATLTSPHSGVVLAIFISHVHLWLGISCLSDDTDGHKRRQLLGKLFEYFVSCFRKVHASEVPALSLPCWFMAMNLKVTEIWRSVPVQDTCGELQRLGLWRLALAIRLQQKVTQ